MKEERKIDGRAFLGASARVAGRLTDKHGLPLSPPGMAARPTR
jgi:hypothetical protein